MMVDVHSFITINIPKQYHNILCHDVLYVTTIMTLLSSTDCMFTVLYLPLIQGCLQLLGPFGVFINGGLHL